jgi:hypothetical protein
MGRLERVQRISRALRYLLIFASAVIGVAIILALLVPGQDWITIGDGQITELWENRAISHTLSSALIAPIGAMLALGVYWLQRLFGEYQAGNFFTDDTMRCYVWLVWLKVASFLYGLIWPMLLMKLPATGNTAEINLSLDAGTLVELIVLLVIVHLLREAQHISDENKAFI